MITNRVVPRLDLFGVVLGRGEFVIRLVAGPGLRLITLETLPPIDGRIMASRRVAAHSHSIISQPSEHLFSLVCCGSRRSYTVRYTAEKDRWSAIDAAESKTGGVLNALTSRLIHV